MNHIKISVCPECGPDFAGLLLFCVEIMPDKVILDHKMSYFFYLKNFHFFRFLAKIGYKQGIGEKKIINRVGGRLKLGL